MNEVKKYDVVILGGGFSGLLSALYLSDAGFDVAVLEKKEATGGFLRTLDFGGAKFDLGGHRLVFAKEKLLTDILKRIDFTDELLTKKKKAGIYLFGKELDYPPTLKDVFVFPLKNILTILKELFFTRFKYSHPANFKQWVKLHYGPSIFKLVFEGYTKKVWGIDAGNLPSSWLSKRIGYFKFLNLFFGIPCVFSKDTQDKFLYPEHGIGSMADSLCSEVKKKSKVMTDVKLSKVSFSPAEGFGLEFVDFEKNTRLIRADKVVSTIPLKELMKVLANKSSYKASSLKYRHIVFLNLILKKDSFLPKAQWLYIPQEDIVFSRIYNFCNWSESLLKQGTSSLSLEIIGDESVLAYDIDFVKKQAFASFLRLGIDIKESDIVDAFLVKEKYAYPLSVGDDEAAIKKLQQDIISDYPGLFFSGRMGQHVYLDIEDCVLSVNQMVKTLQACDK